MGGRRLTIKVGLWEIDGKDVKWNVLIFGSLGYLEFMFVSRPASASPKPIRFI
jgi:hypothetical protein